MLFPLVVALVNVDLVAELVDVAVPTQIDKQAACDILDRPEVECGEYNDDDESQDLLVQDGVEEDEGEDGGALEDHVEEAGDWVEGVGEERVDEALFVLVAHRLHRWRIKVRVECLSCTSWTRNG